VKKIIKFIIIDILRNKIVIAYTVFLLAISFSVFSLEDNSAKGLLSLLNVVMFIVPLVSVIFSAIYMYNSAEFIELLLSQPLRRKKIWLSFFFGLSGSLLIAFFTGIGLPVLLYERTGAGLMLILVGAAISLIFVSVAMFTAVITRDKAKGIGVSILLWLYFAMLFDGLVLFFMFQFADYPLENFIVGVTALNPIDIGRILILLKLDMSALMGYTGAVFRNFFGTVTGYLVTSGILVFWIIIPLSLSVLKFKRKDL
jgi:Cu-processing system permease protein